MYRFLWSFALRLFLGIYVRACVYTYQRCSFTVVLPCCLILMASDHEQVVLVASSFSHPIIVHKALHPLCFSTQRALTILNVNSSK
jgi:hypothetical protein